MPLGFGHTAYGRYAQGRGVNALDLLAAPTGGFVAYLSTRVTLEKTGGYRRLATIEGTPRQLGRGIAEAMPLAAAKKGLTVEEAYLERRARASTRSTPSASSRRSRAGARSSPDDPSTATTPATCPQWGMTIDLARCTGCRPA